MDHHIGRPGQWGEHISTPKHSVRPLLRCGVAQTLASLLQDLVRNLRHIVARRQSHKRFIVALAENTYLAEIMAGPPNRQEDEAHFRPGDVGLHGQITLAFLCGAPDQLI